MLALLIDFLHSSVIIVASPHNNDDVSHESVGAQEHHSPGVFCPPSAPVPTALHHPPPRLFWSFLASKHSPLKSGGYLDVVSSSATDRHHAIAMVSMRAVSTQLLVPFSGIFVALCVVPRKWSVTEFCCFVVFSSNIVPTTRCLSPFPLDTPQLQKLKKHYHRQTGTSSLFRLWHTISSGVISHDTLFINMIIFYSRPPPTIFASTWPNHRSVKRPLLVNQIRKTTPLSAICTSTSDSSSTSTPAPEHTPPASLARQSRQSSLAASLPRTFLAVSLHRQSFCVAFSVFRLASLLYHDRSPAYSLLR
ncbi:hypothetical protein HBI42_219270 [Parastagonospora nodorum]|nr:hypothetical protein HBI47_219520 [Parastagonospora nodorum]KAH6201711.1 hypothetical protein HBI43_216820 [Parastagonospora nodorum]KAH6243400.1 hypothetical protein HBI42_219270 [Parastagonospora nodorum]